MTSASAVAQATAVATVMVVVPDRSRWSRKSAKRRSCPRNLKPRARRRARYSSAARRRSFMACLPATDERYTPGRRGRPWRTGRWLRPICAEAPDRSRLRGALPVAYPEAAVCRNRDTGTTGGSPARRQACLTILVTASGDNPPSGAHTRGGTTPYGRCAGGPVGSTPLWPAPRQRAQEVGSR